MGRIADMATEDQNNGSTEDTSGQEQQEEQQQAPTDDTSGNGEQQQPNTDTVSKDAKLPDDHPVVKQLKADKDKLTAVRAELAEVRAKAANVSKLEQELQARPTTEALETLQTRYDRLESFLQAVGGPLSRALDSRTFTKQLFESDEDVTDLVKAWNRANPSATSQALSSAAAEPGKSKVNPNDLIRAAMRGSK
jgi:hypothetical protein